MCGLAPLPVLSSVTTTEDEDTLKQSALIQCFLVTVQHFFGGFEHLFASVTDPRHPAFITYPLASVLSTGGADVLVPLGSAPPGEPDVA